MSSTTIRDPQAAAIGVYFLLTAVPMALTGLFITFSVNHAPAIGTIGLVIVALGCAITRTVALIAGSSSPRAARVSHAVAGVAALIASGLAAATLLRGATLGSFTLLVATWASVTAVCDILLSLNVTVAVARRDFRLLALAGVVLAVVEISLPLSSVYAVGILGAYGIIVAVYLGIAGATLRFDSVPSPSEGKPTS